MVAGSAATGDAASGAAAPPRISLRDARRASDTAPREDFPTPRMVPRESPSDVPPLPTAASPTAATAAAAAARSPSRAAGTSLLAAAHAAAASVAAAAVAAASGMVPPAVVRTVGGARGPAAAEPSLAAAAAGGAGGAGDAYFPRGIAAFFPPPAETLDSLGEQGMRDLVDSVLMPAMGATAGSAGARATTAAAAAPVAAAGAPDFLTAADEAAAIRAARARHSPSLRSLKQRGAPPAQSARPAALDSADEAAARDAEAEEAFVMDDAASVLAATALERIGAETESAQASPRGEATPSALAMPRGGVDGGAPSLPRTPASAAAGGEAAPPLLPLARAPPPHVPSRGLRILSLDGGGIRGLLMLEALRRIEAGTGRRAHELFDLVVGTSTGGVIALALACHRSTTELAHA
jgi:hypothetical protein